MGALSFLTSPPSQPEHFWPWLLVAAAFCLLLAWLIARNERNR